MKVPARVVEPEAPVRAEGEPWSSAIDARLRSRAAGWGLGQVSSPTLVLGVGSASALLVGARIGGPVGGVIASGVLFAVLPCVRLYTRRRAERLAEAALPEFALQISRSLQTGESLEHALASLEAHTAAGTCVHLLIRQLQAGRPLEPALGAWLTSATSGAERLLAAALTLGVSHGGPLGSALDGVGEALRAELAHSARRRLLLIQATMSTAVLVSLPVVFAIVASIVRGDSVLDDTTGILLVTGGVSFDALGLWWMFVLMRRLR